MVSTSLPKPKSYSMLFKFRNVSISNDILPCHSLAAPSVKEMGLLARRKLTEHLLLIKFQLGWCNNLLLFEWIFLEHMTQNITHISSCTQNPDKTIKVVSLHLEVYWNPIFSMLKLFSPLKSTRNLTLYKV